MTTIRQATAKRVKMAERAQQQMDIHFPGISQAWLWHRTTNDGWITIPRTMPIVMQAIDAVSKGAPAGHTLFGLWARSPDNPVVMIENPATFAGEAGFQGERAVDTWRKRMKKLRELMMIGTKPGASGEFHYVILYNPNSALEYMRYQRQVQDALYGRFIDRLIEIGAITEIEPIKAFTKGLEEKKRKKAAEEAE